MTGVLPTRDRALIAAGIGIITALSWAYMIVLARDPMAMCMVNMKPWSVADLWALFLMWAVMMAAMMLPSASPVILGYSAIQRKRSDASTHAATAAFALGYLAAWSGFSIVATLAQEALHGFSLVSSMGVSTSRLFGAGVLIGAGTFQLTPLKNSCLSYCRTPLGFLLTEWRDGRKGAFVMGWRHGRFCIGCCWLIMALLFIAGVMNLWWVAAISVFVLLEKVAPAGIWIARLSGLALISWGLWTFTRA